MGGGINERKVHSSNSFNETYSFFLLLPMELYQVSGLEPLKTSDFLLLYELQTPLIDGELSSISLSSSLR